MPVSLSLYFDQMSERSNVFRTAMQYSDAEAQKPKTFRVATFYAQKLSGRSARNLSFASHDIVKECVMNVHAPPQPPKQKVSKFHPTGDQQEGPSLIR